MTLIAEHLGLPVMETIANNAPILGAASLGAGLLGYGGRLAAQAYANSPHYANMLLRGNVLPEVFATPSMATQGAYNALTNPEGKPQ